MHVAAITIYAAAAAAAMHVTAITVYVATTTMHNAATAMYVAATARCLLLSPLHSSSRHSQS